MCRAISDSRWEVSSTAWNSVSFSMCWSEKHSATVDTTTYPHISVLHEMIDAGVYMTRSLKVISSINSGPEEAVARVLALYMYVHSEMQIPRLVAATLFVSSSSLSQSLQ